jgi:hypothetical protein
MTGSMLANIFQPEFLRQHWGEVAMAAIMTLVVAKLAFSTLRTLYRTLRHVPVAATSGIGTSGAAATEFVIVMPIMMLVLAGISQLALIAEARLVVAHAAYLAARAAMVIVPEPNDSSGEGRGIIGLDTGLITDFALSRNLPQGKIAQVTQAAAWATMTVSPYAGQWLSELEGETSTTSTRTNFERSYGGTTGTQFLATALGPVQKMLYAGAFTSVVFTGGPGLAARAGSLAASATAGLGSYVSGVIGQGVNTSIGNLVGQYDYLGSYVTNFTPGTEIRARVTYLMYLSVPIASRLVGRHYEQLNERSRFELGTGNGIAGLAGLFGALDGRGYYMTIVIEHSMPAQESHPVELGG